jgi:hypothetical protein
MAKFKDFGAGKQITDREPVSFKLHEEEFHCVANIQGKVLLDLVAKSTSEDSSESARVMSEFFENILTDESYKRFDKLVHAKDKFVHVETLSEIVGWLVGQYSDRPEEQPEA